MFTKSFMKGKGVLMGNRETSICHFYKLFNFKLSMALSLRAMFVSTVVAGSTNKLQG